jgi:hypothetical protein
MTPGNGAFREPELCRVTLYDGSTGDGQGPSLPIETD